MFADNVLLVFFVRDNIIKGKSNLLGMRSEIQMCWQTARPWDKAQDSLALNFRPRCHWLHCILFAPFFRRGKYLPSGCN